MLNAMMLNRLNTNNTITEIFCTLVAFVFFTYVSKKIMFMQLDAINWRQMLDWKYIIKLFKRKNRVEYEGKMAVRVCRFDNRIYHHAHFSSNFNALWKYIIGNVDTNEFIHSIKEYNVLSKTASHDDNDDSNMFIVNQSNEFLIDKKNEIYAMTYNFRESNENEETKKTNDQNESKMDRIIIELYSYRSSVNIIKEFVDDLTAKYLKQIEMRREKKQFIYSLEKLDFETDSYERWKEVPFESTRTFQNLFFENREIVMKKLDYFLQNREWYFDKGIPYSLGIGLHGPPGTGKTSFIKALANYTKRHIVTISLKMIKTKRQLDGIFFENQYSESNTKNSIGFDKKIIVFEDIDCIGDIVKDRTKKNADTCVANTISIADENELKNGYVKIGAITKPLEDPITLDDILNLWDGICETPGRILVITSNHYDELDPALKRPGRIDITLEMQNASRKIIGEMHKHLFKQDICDDALARIPDATYSPAEIINIFMNETNDPAKFCERLIKGKNV